MYEKIFLKLMSLLPHSGEKRGISAKKQRNTYCFRRKTLKKWRKRLAVSNIFVFLQPTGKIPADST